MKRKEVTELLRNERRGSRVIKKRMTKALCVTMAATMVGNAPMMAAAADDVQKSQITATETADEYAMYKTGPEAEMTEENMVPGTELPELEEGVYKVPFHMYNISTLTADDNGNLYAERSMGEQCLSSNEAEIKAEGNKVTIKVSLQARAACTDLNYFMSQEDYENYVNSQEAYLPEIQALKKGGTVDYPEDGVVYTYEATNQEYTYDKALTSITFELPTTSPQIFFVVKAMGMRDAEQYGLFGFDYSKLERVDTPAPETPAAKLQKAVDEAKEIPAEDYTAGSYEKLQNSITAAEALDDTASEEEINAAILDLKAKKEGLVSVKALKAEIDMAQQLVDDKASAEKYTAASLIIYKTALNYAKESYNMKNISQDEVDEQTKRLADAKDLLVSVSTENLDINALEDGIYTVAVNLWNAYSDQESMGNASLYHTASLIVDGGKYTLKVKGRSMMVGTMKGELDALHIIPDGSKPNADESNYKDMKTSYEGEDVVVYIPLENIGNLTEFYYAGIKVRVVDQDGNIYYPMGTDWVENRLRVSWESITQDDAFVSYKELQTVIEEAKKIKADGYTAGSFEKLQKAIASAEKLKKTSSKEELQNATSDIQDKTNALVSVKELKAEIDKAQALVDDEAAAGKYTKASLEMYKNALNSAKTAYNKKNISQDEVDEAAKKLADAKELLVGKADENLDKNALEDGVYTVSVNLWHASSDKESMGNSALYHTAALIVEDGKYTLQVKGHTMTVGTQTGELEALRIVPDGSEPKGDGSNYKEMEITKDGTDVVVNIPLENVGDVSEYYYAGIKVHTVDPDGNIGYPMGKNWVANRLRVSWESLSRKQAADEYPAFSATDEKTGITVSAQEGALPKGTMLRVTKVTEADQKAQIDNALSNLTDKNEPYAISLYVVKDGVEETVEPLNDMELTISLPVPEGYDKEKLVCYYLDENNYANPIQGSVADNKVTVINSKVGVYAVAQKKDRISSITIKPGPSSSTTPSVKPKTGDETNFAATIMGFMAAITAAAGAVVFRKKKEDPEDI